MVTLAKLTVTLQLSLATCWLLIATAGVGFAAPPASVERLQVRLVTSANELSAGSLVELRIYEAGKPVRRLALSHGEAWPGDSTRLIPLTLSEPLDPRAVLRFGLYFRPASPLTPDLQVASAEVDVLRPHEPPERLLNATLSGVIARQGELATEDRDPAAVVCASDADCDDQRSCNGRECCAPRSPGADARGCVKGIPVVCPVNQVCSEERGCRGPDSLGEK